MTSFLLGEPKPSALCPDELRVIADVFEEALQLIPESAFDLKPYAARQLLARYVIDNALSGERDPKRLRDLALEQLALLASKQSA